MPPNAVDQAPKTAPAWRLLGLGFWQAVGTLKFRVLLVAVMSALLSGVASSYFMSNESERVMLTSFNLQQRDEVELAAEMLSSKVSRVQASLGLMASSITPDLLERPAALERQLHSHPFMLEMFSAVQVVKIDGSVRAKAARSVQPLEGVDFTSLGYFQRTVTMGINGVSDPLVSDLVPEPMVVMTVPVRDLGGRIFAVMVGALPLQSSDLLPSAASTLGQFAAALIVYTPSGTVLSHPDTQRRLQPVADEPGLGPVVAEWQAHGGKAADAGATRDPRFLVATAHVPAADWYVARVTSTSYALQPLYLARTRSWAVVIGIMAVCAVLSTLLISNITRPITQLRDRAQQLLGTDQDAGAGWPEASGEIGQLVQVFRHVTLERGRAQAAQNIMVEQLKAILKNASVGIVITRDRHFELVGSQANRLFGYAEDELQGLDASVIYVSLQAYHEAGERFRTSLKMLGYFDGEVVLRRKDGSQILVHMRGRGVIDGDPAAGVIWILTDVTAARAVQDQLSWTASHDSLTQLVNRRDFESRLAQAIAYAVHPSELDICAMFIDLDRFKPINDTAGHAAGDEVLRQIARLLESRVRQTDTVARMGGDEFAILLPGCSMERAQRIAEQVRVGVEAWRMHWRTHTFTLSASIGVVQLSPELNDVAAVLEAADSACYDAKRGGRNRVVTYGTTPYGQRA
ncbi:diguanylate cyclase domain-containing protein [Rhodoferax sp.]|uniref:sensor domain-containing diguanylate cyclase n=1 Tax=Rhodoferax sp. TaxID=50421 RepID=UPI00374DBB5B